MTNRSIDDAKGQGSGSRWRPSLVAAIPWGNRWW